MTYYFSSSFFLLHKIFQKPNSQKKDFHESFTDRIQYPKLCISIFSCMTCHFHSSTSINFLFLFKVILSSKYSHWKKDSSLASKCLWCCKFVAAIFVSRYLWKAHRVRDFFPSHKYVIFKITSKFTLFVGCQNIFEKVRENTAS